MSQTLRIRKLILPRLQLWLVGSFLAVTILTMGLQFLVLGQRLTRQAAAYEGSTSEFAAEVPTILIGVFGSSALIILPLILCLGVLWTFKVAGPVYRFEQYLDEVVRGEAKGPCVLRKNDRLKSLCQKINAATEPLIEAQGREVEPSETREAA